METNISIKVFEKLEKCQKYKNWKKNIKIQFIFNLNKYYIFTELETIKGIINLFFPKICKINKL